MSYSPAPLVLDRSKPAPWNVEGAFTSPEWDWFWRYASHAAIYNEGNGKPYDFVARQLPSTFTGWTWEPTRRGMGVRRSGTAPRLIWPKHPGYNMDGDVEFSTGVALVMENQQSAGGFIAHRDTSDPGYWELFSGSGTDIVFSVRTSSNTAESVSWPGANPLLDSFTEIHTFFVARREGGVYELWVDGVSHGTQTNALAVADPTLHDLEIGRRGNNSSPQDGIYLLSFVLPLHAMSQAEATQLNNDLYGPFRPNWDYLTAFSSASLFATGDGTIVDVVNENDQGGA